MWAEIRRARDAARGRPRLGPWLRWGAGLAAALVIGVGIGRFSVNGETSPVSTTVADAGNGEDERSGAAFDVAARQHFGRVEALLVGFRADARTGRPVRQTTGSARELLTTTRLLLGSPAADDVALRTLLEDVELVLAQIAQYREEAAPRELGLIDDGIQRKGMLLRLSAAASPPEGSERFQGAL
jgi:hypothetical protein